MKLTVLTPLLVLVLVGANPASSDDKPAPKPAGKPTRITGPLDKKGRIDYEAALNEQLGKGVTAETNANVLLYQVFGPAPEGGDGMPDEYFKLLGMPRPPQDGNYFGGIGTYGRKQLSLGDDQLSALFDQMDQARARPWKAADYPSVAAWLKLDEKHLAAVVGATKRPHYFNPLVSTRNKDGESGGLIGALLPSVQKCRELAAALTARAMLRVGEGKFDEAWADLLACHRLARLVSRGGTLIEALVGIAINQIACNAELAWLEAAKPTADQARARLKDLQNLPPFRPVAELVDVGERCMGMDSLQLIRRGYGGGLIDGVGGKPTPEELKALESLDWAEMENVCNGYYDRMVAALRVRDRAAREKAFDKLDADFEAARKLVKDEPFNFGALAKLFGGPKVDPKVVSRKVAETLMGLLAPAVRKVNGAFDRAEQIARNQELAFALAAYRADEGKYPARLADLAPRYLPAVPDDVFAGKPLTYRVEDNGYLFYSIGQDGKDDGGRSFDDDPRGDDLRVRMPLPAPKKP
ncbi:MAG: hypothetical protein C0501_22690 [Isosphaera sp.]|nr:hypothetical protein [Isosphaera sp.]